MFKKNNLCIYLTSIGLMSCYLPMFEMKSCITCLCAQILVNALDVNVYDTVVNDLSKTSNCRVFIN